MQSPFVRFNLYLLLAVALLIAGCRTPEERRARQMQSTLRLHLTARPGDTELREPVQIGGVTLFVERAFFLDERSVDEAQILDSPEGAFLMRIAFNSHGRLMLENVSGSHPGRQIVLFSHFGDRKSTQAAWFAAPRIPRRISDGVLVFTPILPRDLAEDIVQGLNNVAARQKRYLSW
jgi:hypothetical protein